MKWHLLNAAASFEDCRKDWDALNRANSNHILLDSRFVAPLLKNFGDTDVVLAVNKQNDATGIALLVRSQLGSWSTFQPSQAPLGMIILRFRDDHHEILFDLMKALPGYPMILGVMQQDPLYSSFPASPNGSNIEILDYIDTPRLPIKGSFEEYWNARGKNLKHNLDRQGRRIKEQGRRLELIAERDPARIEDCILEYGRLESTGWKGKEGTAVAADNAQGRFYCDIFEDFAATGEAVIFQLLLDGQIVASDLCLVRDGMVVVLKTAYDESTERLSPALLMRKEIIKHFHESGNVNVVEFYGKVRDWHLQWTSETRMMYHVNLFRNVSVKTTRKLLERLR